MRQVARLPIWLYHVGLGFVLGKRFLLLTHIGRTSGLPRHTVLEVIGHDHASDTYFVVSAWGETADWFLNIQKTPPAIMTVGRRRMNAIARRLPPAEAERVMLNYARHHPIAARVLPRVSGYRVDGTEADFRALGRRLVIVALQPPNQ
jgi:deazaflavin-dependent oxidoreductase (nitroreductase family)